MKRVLVIGSPGAGKSTFARNLRDKTGLPLYHLDNIWHKPDRTTISREEFDERLAAILAKDSWIIDGNYSRTLELRLQYCDTVFLLDYPLEVCLAGVSDRIGKKRDDIPWTEHEFDEELRQFIVEFPEIYPTLLIINAQSLHIANSLVIGFMDKIFCLAHKRLWHLTFIIKVST